MIPLDSAAVERAAAGEPEWRRAARTAAHRHYEKLAPPVSSEEMWRYVDLDFSLADYALATSAADAAPPAIGDLAVDRHFTVVDGRAGSALEHDGEKTWVGSVLAAPDFVDDAMRIARNHAVPDDLDQFAAAHGAFGGDGAVVFAGAGSDSGAVLVDVLAATPDAVTFPRIILIADEAAMVSLIVRMSSPAGVRALVVPRLEIVAGSASNVKVSVIQEFGSATNSIAHARASVGRDANLVLAEAGLGAALSRLHLTVDLEGRGSSANIVGAYFGDQRQVLDYRYFMHHSGLNTRSDMFLKGAVEDDALSVFTGMIRIDESAQRTDAFQTNRNLILSEGAAAQSVPNLEILANDVRCGHGSTVGPLDEEQRYYLMSRGLDPERADRLQVRGFFREALDRFPHPSVTAPLGAAINAKFVEAQEEGRV